MNKLYYGAIYETTNQVNGMKYIGKVVFARQNNWQFYLGSGTYLKRAIKKYGKVNFIKRILAVASTDEELNNLEESFIRMLNAVESKDFYNLKYTSIGGDTFTNNPNKENIRKLKSINSSGQRNGMYGKIKTQAMLDAVKAANSKAVSINGTIYSSAVEASKDLQIPYGTVNSRIRSDTFKTWFKL